MKHFGLIPPSPLDVCERLQLLLHDEHGGKGRSRRCDRLPSPQIAGGVVKLLDADVNHSASSEGEPHRHEARKEAHEVEGSDGHQGLGDARQNGNDRSTPCGDAPRHQGQAHDEALGHIMYCEEHRDVETETRIQLPVEGNTHRDALRHGMNEHDYEDEQRPFHVRPLCEDAAELGDTRFLLVFELSLTGFDEQPANDESNEGLPISESTMVMCLSQHTRRRCQHHGACDCVRESERSLADSGGAQERKGQHSKACRETCEQTGHEDAEVFLCDGHGHLALSLGLRLLRKGSEREVDANSYGT
mmetsp:Transcript_8923/g.23190  ORF Transcript_8923/g.23190 Transcript_8923/m.23190 type:complete len:303 (+) Transcript_8923:201-1109(+)